MSLLELLHYDFFLRALIVGALVGLSCSTVGVFVVLRGLSVIGAGISHAALAGVAIGILLGVPATFTAFVFCSFLAVCIGYAGRLGRIKEDTSVGILYAASMALAVFLIGFVHDQRIDLMSYLFGAILNTSRYDLYVSLVLGGVVVLTLVIFYKEFVAVAFDQELARIAGVPAALISYLLLVLMALSVVVSMTLVGIVLVSALIVTPAATALLLSKDVHKAVWLSALLGVFSTEAGLIAALYLDTAPGATIVLLSTLLFFGAGLVAQFRRA